MSDIRTLLVAVLLTTFMPYPSAVADTIRADLVRVSDAFLNSPHDMVLSPDGKTLIVADMGHSRLALLDPESLALKGEIGKGELSLPHDIAFDAEGRLWVADSGNDRIVVYEVAPDFTGAKIRDTVDGLDGPEGIVVASDGTIYASITLEDRVVHIIDGHINASISMAFGREFYQPHDIEVIENNGERYVIVVDPGHHRLVLLDGNLTPLQEIRGGASPLSSPKYASIDAHHRVFVADQFNHCIKVFDLQARQIAQFAKQHIKLPEGILAVRNRVWVSDTLRGRVLLYRLSETP